MPAANTPTPRPRLRRALVPLSFAATIAAGVGIAYVLAAATGGDDAPSGPVTRPSRTPASPSATQAAARPTPVPQVLPCQPGDVSASLDVEARDGAVLLQFSLAGEKPCRLTGDVRLVTVIAPSDPEPRTPPFANMAREHTLDLAFPFSGVLAEWTWSNWCGDPRSISWIVEAGNASFRLQAPIHLDADATVFPACDDPDAPATLSDLLLADALGGAAVLPNCQAPIEAWLCQFAIFLERAQAAGELGPVVRQGIATEYTCGEGVLPGFEFTAICQGAAAGEGRTGYPLALHGSEGGPLTVAAMIARLEDELPSPLDSPEGITAEAAAVGFPIEEGEHRRFIVVIATGGQPAAVYLAFELVPGREPAFIGAGLSGDNAMTLLRGGTTVSVLGEAEFAPLGR